MVSKIDFETKSLPLTLESDVGTLASRAVDIENWLGDIGDRCNAINHPGTTLAVLGKHQGIGLAGSSVHSPWSLVLGVLFPATAMASNAKD